MSVKKDAELEGTLAGVEILLRSEMSDVLKKRCVLSVLDRLGAAHNVKDYADGDNGARSSLPLNVDDVELTMEWVESVVAFNDLG